MSIQIVPLTEAHLQAFTYTGARISLLELGDLKAVLTLYLQHGDAQVALVDGVPQALAGVVPVWQGVGQTWLVLNPEAERYAKTILRTIREELPKIAEARRYHRLQTWVNATDLQSQRFAQAYGLKLEGCMKKFNAKGEDFLVYAMAYPRPTA